MIGERPEGAVDATGFETRHTSSYYVDRKGYREFLRRRWPKLTVVCETGSYLFAGMNTGHGPSNDSPYMPEAMRQAARHIAFDRVLADAAYDGEHNHALCRDELGIRSTVIPINARAGASGPPKTKYRRQMHTRFFNRVYGRRWHVESAISQTKRVLGAALRARTDPSQEREQYLRVLTHDLMRIRRLHTTCFQQSIRGFK
jgi:transposase